MTDAEVLAEMFKQCSSHLDSLECYEDFLGVDPRKVDKAKLLVQALLTRLSEDYKKQARKLEKEER